MADAVDQQDELRKLLERCAPFDSLDPADIRAAAQQARIEQFQPGELIVDAFEQPPVEVFVVLAGDVELWNSADTVSQLADERLGPGGVFGFSAMLTERSVGPRALAVTDVTIACIPATAVSPAFATRGGAQFLAKHVSAGTRRLAGVPTYSLVDELIVHAPLTVLPSTPVGEVAQLMTSQDVQCAAVDLGDGTFGLVTDAILRKRVLVDGLPADTPAHQVMQPSVPVTILGDSAAEALILMLDTQAEFVLVTDRSATLRGVIAPRDFVVSPTTAGAALHEQIRRAASADDLIERARRLPGMLGDALSRGLAATKVIAVNSAVIDTIVRRALTLVFDTHPELSLEAFTWLSLGSNGRREAVLSSDVDSAVAFDDSVSAADADRYRAAFAEVEQLLTKAGLRIDDHGATARRAQFARRNSDWRAAAQQWLAAPEQDKGAIMISLLVDGRPIHGDRGLPAAAKVFNDLREHPATMRLLLRESLSHRAKLRSIGEVLTRRPEEIDIKAHALLPVVNIARWAALSVRSAELRTTERLRKAAGSQMLGDDHARTLIEVFEVLQRVRLRYQLAQRTRGDEPSDLLVFGRMSPLDRSVVAQAVREIAAVQRRMGNIAAYVPHDAWASPTRT